MLWLPSTRFMWWGGWGLSCVFALWGGGLFIGLKGLWAVVGVMEVRVCEPRAIPLYPVWDGDNWGVFVIRVYLGEVFGCYSGVYVLAELHGCDVGCVLFFDVVYSVVYLYFVVVDFEYF